MKYTLELLPIGDNSKDPGLLRESEPVSLYEVSGLPPGEHVWITQVNGSWKISHTRNSIPGDWTGHYKSPEDALACLLKQFEK